MGTHPIFESDFDCLTEKKMPEGKSDMERVGLFSEMEYHTIGDRYAGRDPASVPFNQSAYKKRQMIPGGSKIKVEGLQAGYFEPTFKRIMEKEAYNDPVKTRYAFCHMIG